MKLADILLEGSDTHKHGLMVGLWVPPAEALRLAVPGGEDPEELHVTLAYLGKGLSRSLTERVRDACRSYAAWNRPLAGKVATAGRFPATDKSDGKDVLIAKPDIPGLLRFREGLVKRLENVGATVSHNFEFTPHVTLAYVSPGSGSLPEVPPVPLRFSSLVVACGGDRRHYPFGG